MRNFFGMMTILVPLCTFTLTGCGNNEEATPAPAPPTEQPLTLSSTRPPGDFLNEPLVTHLYIADPSAHVFNGKLFIYPSHDIDAEAPGNSAGDKFAMRDYHVFSMEKIGGPVTDHGVVLDIKDVPWAGRQMWAPDVAEKGGKYFFYFPAKDKQDIFRIGVAIGDKPEGPFTAEAEPIKDSFSIDPAVFKDDDGSYYMYFGGIAGGQLQRWQSGSYSPNDEYPPDQAPALRPKVAKLADDMKSFAEKPHDIYLLDANGGLLTTGDNHRRFFEAAWVHKYNGTYYFSYSTGDTHNIMYATGPSAYGPFTWRGKLLEPVLGWTNHHSIVEFQGKWYLFYHDSSLSKGQTHLRSVKVTELHHNADGTINTIDTYFAD